MRYYRLEDLHARVWIGHHRYSTKRRVWHPGGAHPFAGMHEALVHNGDFADYASISSYLAQHGITPPFLTDTEVAVLVFDLLQRTFGYPLEHVQRLHPGRLVVLARAVAFSLVLRSTRARRSFQSPIVICRFGSREYPSVLAAMQCRAKLHV